MELEIYANSTVGLFVTLRDVETGAVITDASEVEMRLVPPDGSGLETTVKSLTAGEVELVGERYRAKFDAPESAPGRYAGVVVGYSAAGDRITEVERFTVKEVPS